METERRVRERPDCERERRGTPSPLAAFLHAKW